MISCPTCGRIQVDVAAVAQAVEEALEKYHTESPKAPRPLVAVMGCMVNGPGEATHADIAIAGGKGKFALYENGKHIATIAESKAVEAVIKRVRNWRRRR